MHPEGRNKLVKKKSALKLSSEAVEVYCRYEALDFSEDPRELWKDFYPDFQYEYPRYECGIFAIPSQDPDLPERLLIVYKFMERCASRIWKCGIVWILLFISRRVSGISKAEDVDLDPSSSDAEVRRKHKCCGYYGWGKIAVVLDADVLCDRVRVEFSNMSLVAALFLTFTVPLLVDPPDAIMLYTNESSFPGFNPRLVQSLYVTFSSIAVAYQLTTVTTALLMITNLNKCQASSGESGVLFIKSIFSPYNGITGTIGPALYIATTLSVCATIWVTMLTCFATYNDPVDIWLIQFVVVIISFFIVFGQLLLGIMTEVHVMTPELSRFAANPQAQIVEINERKEKS